MGWVRESFSGAKSCKPQYIPCLEIPYLGSSIGWHMLFLGSCDWGGWGDDPSLLSLAECLRDSLVPPEPAWTYPTHFRSQGVVGLGICTCSSVPLFSGLRKWTSQDSGSREWPAFHSTRGHSVSAAPRFFLMGSALHSRPHSFVDRCLLLFWVGRMASQLRCGKEGLLSWVSSQASQGWCLLVFQPQGAVEGRAVGVRHA